MAEFLQGTVRVGFLHIVNMFIVRLEGIPVGLEHSNVVLHLKYRFASTVVFA